ncbi:hypothetical protein QBC36DRAFT_315687 [Triangularia setosa]|uniref:Uncharacterized protein n=1 Tax=Triangularia setosa TaxID=2587417 RepID=A0AAN6VXI4_9PEZI|nr:hypothetical protein QBC36DRAFT_315687 [Podospora setosa]
MDPHGLEVLQGSCGKDAVGNPIQDYQGKITSQTHFESLKQECWIKSNHTKGDTDQSDIPSTDEEKRVLFQEFRQAIVSPTPPGAITSAHWQSVRVKGLADFEIEMCCCTTNPRLTGHPSRAYPSNASFSAVNPAGLGLISHSSQNGPQNATTTTLPGPATRAPSLSGFDGARHATGLYYHPINKPLFLPSSTRLNLASRSAECSEPSDASVFTPDTTTSHVPESTEFNVNGSGFGPTNCGPIDINSIIFGPSIYAATGLDPSGYDTNGFEYPSLDALLAASTMPDLDTNDGFTNHDPANLLSPAGLNPVGPVPAGLDPASIDRADSNSVDSDPTHAGPVNTNWPAGGFHGFNFE